MRRATRLAGLIVAAANMSGLLSSGRFAIAPTASAAFDQTGRGLAPASSDWIGWRGARRDGAILGLNAPAVWPEQLISRWKVDVGLGYASPLVVGNRVFQFSRVGENEVMSALDAATGGVVWRTSYPATFQMNNSTSAHGPGPKSTPVFFDGKLFSIGMAGTVTAFDAATGKQLWQKTGGPAQPIFTSHAFSPIVDAGRVIFHVGGNNQGALTAFDVETGDVRWSWTGDGPSYGSPVLATIDGVRQLVTLTQTKLIGVDPASGALLWERPFTNSSVTNAATPIVEDHTVIVSNGGPVVAVTVTRRAGQWVVEPAWENAETPYRLSNTVSTDGVLVGLSTRNSGQYFGVDIATGKMLWTSEPRQAGNAAILKAGNIWFSLESDGELVVARSSRTSFDVVQRYRLSDAETWTQPAFSGNRVFVKDVTMLSLWTWN